VIFRPLGGNDFEHSPQTPDVTSTQQQVSNAHCSCLAV
jgi:hypothetical protein